MVDSRIVYLPPNLAKLGVPRRVPAPEPDLETVWLTPYPVLTNYEKLCLVVGLTAYGGGTRQRQADYVDGFVTSGYRSEIINGNEDSPHRYGFALDFIVADPELQVHVARTAIQCGLFTRVGLYPDRGFVHVDQAPEVWIKRYNKLWYWSNRAGKYKYYGKEQLHLLLREAA